MLLSTFSFAFSETADSIVMTIKKMYALIGFLIKKVIRDNNIAKLIKKKCNVKIRVLSLHIIVAVANVECSLGEAS